MSILSNIFYSFSVVFLIFEIFQLFNRNSIYNKIDISNIKIGDSIVYLSIYLTKLLYLSWVIVGMFSPYYILFLSLIIIGLVKNIIFLFRSDILINLYEVINVIVSCCLLILIFNQLFSRL